MISQAVLHKQTDFSVNIQSPLAVMNAKNPALKALFTNFYYERSV